MTSQLDLDQGGTARQWVRTYMGPTVGWVYLPGLNPLPIITAAGTYVILPDTTLVQLNVAALVTIMLPTAIEPTVVATTLPALFARKPITIVDIGGNCQTFNCTIMPASIAENIMGLASIKIKVNYGAFTLNPSTTQRGWTNISP